MDPHPIPPPFRGREEQAARPELRPRGKCVPLAPPPPKRGRSARSAGWGSSCNQRAEKDSIIAAAVVPLKLAPMGSSPGQALPLLGGGLLTRASDHAAARGPGVEQAARSWQEA